MKRRRANRELAVAAGAGVATLLLSLFVIPANLAAGKTAAAPTMSWLLCARPVTPPRDLPASLKGWYSRQNKYLTDRIGLDQRALAREGVQLTQWGPDPCSGKVKVYLTHYSRAAAKILISKYGNDVIISHHSIPRFSPSGRINDQSPFSGGDFIHTDIGFCTGGPIVEGNTNNEPYMLTAGHCVRSLRAVVRRTDRSGNNGPKIGIVNVIRFCNNCIDSAQIRRGSTGANYIYYVEGGGDNSGLKYREDGPCFPQPSNRVTADSAFTGEVTGAVVEDVNQSVTGADGVTRVELTFAYGGSTAIVNPGDSGGPWIQHLPNTNKVCIAGTTVGEPCNPGPCDFAYYQQIDGIDKFLNTRVPKS
jgi:hypothetical protein